jgi:hypothetical protein
MKFKIFLFLFITNTAISQVKTFNLYGKTHLNLIYSTLNTYAKNNDSISKTAYGIYDDSLMQMGSIIIKTVEGGSSQFPTLDISQLDTAFNLITDLKDKVYLLSRSDSKDCYFLKDDKTLIRKVLNKSHIWHQVEYGEYKIYKFDLENNRIIFWANGLGIIYKTKNELKTNFLPLEYFYKYNQYEIAGNRSEILIKDKDSVNMEVDYFDFGEYKIVQKQKNNKEDKYIATKNSKIVLEDLSIKYYNTKNLMTYGNGLLTFYNNNLKIDSQFYYRQIYEGWDNLEFLVNNQIKKISIQGYIPTFQKNINGVCGTVAYYTLKLNKSNATLFSDLEILGKVSTTKEIPIISKFESDSMIFTTHQKEMKWNGNGGFDDQIILFKNGKQGLYNYILKDTLLVLKEILPTEFNSIHLVNGNLVVNKREQEDFFTYYIQHKKMRFKQISYEKCNYLRYKKNNDIKGWVDNKGVLFDDK